MILREVAIPVIIFIACFSWLLGWTSHEIFEDSVNFYPESCLDSQTDNQQNIIPEDNKIKVLQK